MTPAAEPAALELRTIRGPSAFGGDSRRFWNLVRLTAAADFKTRYLSSWLGYAWSLLRPLLFFGVLYLVFTRVIRFGDQVENYAALLLFNIMLFQFFQDATGSAVRCVVQRESLVRKMQFPRIVVPLSVVLNASMTALMNLVAALLLIIAIGVEPRWTWLLLPVILAALLVFTTGVSLALAALYPRFRDVEQIWTVASRALLREPGHLSDRVRAGVLARAGGGEPADANPRTGEDLGHRSVRPRPCGDGRQRGGTADPRCDLRRCLRNRLRALRARSPPGGGEL